LDVLADPFSLRVYFHCIVVDADGICVQGSSEVACFQAGIVIGSSKHRETI
jgi:hypothetical protein